MQAGKKGLLIFIFALICCAIVLSIVYIKEEPQKSNSELSKINIGYLPIAASLPLFVAKAEAYFEKRGIEVTLVEFKDSNALAIAGVTGKVDVMVTCATNAALDAMATSKSSLQIFLVNGYIKGGDGVKSTDYLLARPGISLKDLKGKKVAFFPGSVSKVFANLVLPKYGLFLNDIEYIEMSPEGWLPALKSGKIDAVNAVEPAASMIIRDKVGEILIDGFFAEVSQNVPLSGVWFSSTNLKEAEKQTVVDAFSEALSLISRNRDKATSYYSLYTKIPPEIYNEIGLNNWKLVNDDETKLSLKKFVDLLKYNDAILEAPTSNWIWEGNEK